MNDHISQMLLFKKSKAVSIKETIAMRESGILMHITSLPAPYGIGTMGKDAYAFVDFLDRIVHLLLISKYHQYEHIHLSEINTLKSKKGRQL